LEPDRRDCGAVARGSVPFLCHRRSSLANQTRGKLSWNCLQEAVNRRTLITRIGSQLLVAGGVVFRLTDFSGRVASECFGRSSSRLRSARQNRLVQSRRPKLLQQPAFVGPLNGDEQQEVRRILGVSARDPCTAVSGDPVAGAAGRGPRRPAGGRVRRLGTRRNWLP